MAGGVAVLVAADVAVGVEVLVAVDVAVGVLVTVGVDVAGLSPPGVSVAVGWKGAPGPPVWPSGLGSMRMANAQSPSALWSSTCSLRVTETTSGAVTKPGGEK